MYDGIAAGEAGTVPGSDGERRLQELYGTRERAEAFYENQVLDELNVFMQRFIAERDMVFIATSDGRGECDASFRAGPPGFVRVLGGRTLMYPEYRGNGVLASLGNLSENPHIGLLFIDFYQTCIGLHVNGTARIVEAAGAEAAAAAPDARAVLWVEVAVEEAYIHCAKHIPLLARGDKEIHWGTDDEAQKGGDFFGVRRARRARPSRTCEKVWSQVKSEHI